MAGVKLVDAQRALAILGSYDGPPHGDPREPNWRGDLRRFQREHGLEDDGLYGPKTDAVVAPLLAKVQAALGGTPGFVRMQNWQLTAYWIGQARTGPVPLPGRDGSTLARVSPSSSVEAGLEGTTVLPSGKLVNVASHPSSVPVRAGDYAAVLAIAERNGWIPDKAGYAGITVAKDAAGVYHVTEARAFQEVPVGPHGWPYWNGIEADPYHTLAADIGRTAKDDPRFKGKGGLVPVGTKVFVLGLAGKVLPDGRIHDGWCVVNDTGGGIYGAHFDVFTGFKTNYQILRPPSRTLIWFAGVEQRCPVDYPYGLA